MCTEYRKGTEADYEDIVDFINMVFRNDLGSHVLKLYHNHPEMAVYHELALENGKIKATAGSYPLKFRLNGETLRARGIGAVSVHPYTRGRGYMKKLVSQAVEEAKAEGADFMCLGGLRQRYEYFGFGSAAGQRCFLLTPDNRRHHPEISTDGITVLKLSEHPEYSEICRALYEHQPFYAVRPPEQFIEICSTWTSTPWIILNHGKPAGYGVVNQQNRIPELFLSEDQPVLPLVFALVEKFGAELQITANPWQKSLIRGLASAAERCSIQTGEMFRILNFPKMLTLLLKLKAEYTPLMDGSRVYEIPGTGKFRVTVSEGSPAVSETEDPADCSMSLPAMQNYLFCISNLWQYETPAENSWFPLYFSLPGQDMV